MARRLVERGVTYVEVSLDGWDTHANNFDALSRRLLPELDKGMSSLVADLAERRLLDTTTIVWMGEFGRTPRINQNAGRDHWPRSWSVVIGGGGMKGGKVVGATDKDGIDIVDRPVGVMDLIATMTKIDGNQRRCPVHDSARPSHQDRRRRQADRRDRGLTGFRDFKTYLGGTRRGECWSNGRKRPPPHHRIAKSHSRIWHSSASPARSAGARDEPTASTPRRGTRGPR